MAKSLNLAGRIVLIGMGLAGLLRVGGCATQQSEPVLTQEQRAAIVQYMIEKEQKRQEQRDALVKYMIEKSERERQQAQANPNYPAKSQSERDADVTDDILGRVGAGAVLQGLSNFVRDYSK